jgi:hypothetical protein
LSRGATGADFLGSGPSKLIREEPHRHREEKGRQQERFLRKTGYQEGKRTGFFFSCLPGFLGGFSSLLSSLCLCGSLLSALLAVRTL